MMTHGNQTEQEVVTQRTTEIRWPRQPNGAGGSRGSIEMPWLW